MEAIEKAIKEAWANLMPDYTGINLTDGWSLNDFNEGDFDDMNFDTMQIYATCKIRPKTLRGIEANNGWIKIKSEADLPKEYIECYFITIYSDNTIKTGSFSSSDKIFYSNNNYNINEVTHYQPIIKPKPPIY